MRRALSIAAVVIGLPVMLLPAQVSAASITFDFPTASTTIETPGGGSGTAAVTGFFHRAGEVLPAFMEETFLDTTLLLVNALDLNLVVATNVLVGSATVDFDVLLNSLSVGNFSVDQGFGTGPLNLSFGFSPIAGFGTGGTDYTLLINMTNNVALGAGSISFSKAPAAQTSITLSDTAPIPEPGTLLLLGSGVVGMGTMVRRRNRRK